MIGRLFILCLALAAFTLALDQPCFDGAGAKMVNADNCPNKLPQADCDKVFPITAGPPAAPSANCLASGEELPAGLCRKNCFTCCRDPAYNCDDVPGGVDCTKIDCASTGFHAALVKYCAATCGFCQERGGAGNCVDASDNCSLVKGLCNDIYHGAEVRPKCRKTCSACNEVFPTGNAPVVVPTPPTPPGDCKDVNVNCVIGWCTEFPQDVLKKSCAKTCNLC